MGKQTGNGKACYVAAYWEMLVLIATFLTLGLMYAFLGTAEVIQAHQLQLLCAAAPSLLDVALPPRSRTNPRATKPWIKQRPS